ncbi:MAG: YfhO family protein [Phycisphaerae bacterium]|jgi:hypothetical protein
MTVPVQRRAWVCTALALLPVAVLGGAWRLGGVSALEDDLIYYLPIRDYIGQRVRAGEWPLWNPHVALGTSVAADPQSGLWYPPTLLFALLPPLTAYPLSLVLHFALAGGGMYRFLRAGRHDWRAALLGAVAFEMGGTLIAHRAHLTIHHAAAWLPWMLYGWRRFAQTGRLRHAGLASAAFGAQLLVQHIQISIISAVLVGAYVLIVLAGRRGTDGAGPSLVARGRRSLLWAFPAGMTAGAMVAGVQIVPTWLHVAGSVRAVPSYDLFNENAWWPRSAILSFFPFVYGARTPNAWVEPWHGESHYCEQAAYFGILVLLLAGASWRLARPESASPPIGAGRSRRWGRVVGLACFYAPRTFRLFRRGTLLAGPTESELLGGNRHGRKLRRSVGRELRLAWQTATTGWQPEPAFWWWASAAAMIVALGDLTPLGRLLFHVPVYRGLRVPARWILVWSVAVPVLASMTLSALLRGAGSGPRLSETLRHLGGRVLPIAAAALLLVPWPGAGWLIARLNTPAVWWPVLVMMATAWSLLHWMRTRVTWSLALLFAVFLADVAAVAALVDVDTRTYARRELIDPPPLVRAIERLAPRPGDRLLVPRARSDYHRPVEVLWPQYNVRYGVATLNGYGPLGQAGVWMLLRFMPWGSSEEMIALLRNGRLLRTLGVRFLAVRSRHERDLLAAAAMPAVSDPPVPVPGAERAGRIADRDGALWGPVDIKAGGLYELSFEVESPRGLSSRWFVRLETPEKTQIADTRVIEPLELSERPRRMRFVYRLEPPPRTLMIRVKSEMGGTMAAGRAEFRRIAEVPPSSSSRAGAAATGPFVHRMDLPGAISLYELPGSRPDVYWARRVEPVPGLAAVVDRLWSPAGEADEVALVEMPAGSVPPPDATDGRLDVKYRSAEERVASVSSAGGGLLVLNESHDPGWRAWVDGVPAPVLRVNGVCQGVAVPGGLHEVRFIYRPRGLGLGAVLSVTGIAILAAAVGLKGARLTAPNGDSTARAPHAPAGSARMS